MLYVAVILLLGRLSLGLVSCYLLLVLGWNVQQLVQVVIEFRLVV